MIPVLGYAPDLEPSTQGALKDVTDMIPTKRGMRGAPSPVATAYAALSEAANALAVTTKLDGSRRIFAGTNSSIQETDGAGSWTDRTNAGGAYSCGIDNRWSFAQFGDTTIAACKAEPLQSITGGAAFADLNALQASHVAVNGGFVMIADINDTVTYGDQSDRWWCSAYLDATDWTLSVANQCVTGRLVDDPGAIKGLRPFGTGFVIYKEASIYVGTYVGAPAVWQWDKIPGDVGCTANYGIVDVGDAHFFLGRDNVYVFDGVRPVPIGEDIREYLYSDIDDAKLYRLMGAYDYELANVWWYYCSKSNGGAIPDKAIVYNRTTGKWGKYSLSVEAAARYYTEGITYNNLGGEYSTYDDLPTTISYDSPYWIADNPDLAVVKTDHKLYTLNGTAGNTSCTLFNMGDDTRFSTFRRLRPRFYTEPSSSTMEYGYDDLHGDSFTSKSTPTYSNGKYDTLHSSRWHECKLNFTGNVEIVGVTPDIVPDGDE